MPEYAALIHHHNLTNDSEEGPPPDASEVTEMFLRMERLGIGRVH